MTSTRRFSRRPSAVAFDANRFFFAVTAGGDALSANSIFNQKVPYRIRPSLGQIKIVAFLPTTIGMAFNMDVRFGCSFSIVTNG